MKQKQKKKEQDYFLSSELWQFKNLKEKFKSGRATVKSDQFMSQNGNLNIYLKIYFQANVFHTI